MQSLIVKSVLPKLTETMKTRLQINPKNQELGNTFFFFSLFCLTHLHILNNLLDVFNCIMRWRDLFTPKVFNQLFEDTFFIKWLDTLYIWLTHNPNYDEIRQWLVVF